MARGRIRIRGKRRLRRKLKNYVQDVRVEVAREMTVILGEIQDTARRLAPVDTSNLQGSIQMEPAAVDPGDLTGYVGTNVEYARVHEFGFTGEVSVSAHKRTMEQGFGPDSEYPMVVTVPAHTRRMDIEGKFYMTKAMQAAAQTYNKRIGEAIERAAP